jgi:hypothetical protein
LDYAPLDKEVRDPVEDISDIDAPPKKAPVKGTRKRKKPAATETDSDSAQDNPKPARRTKKTKRTPPSDTDREDAMASAAPPTRKVNDLSPSDTSTVNNPAPRTRKVNDSSPSDTSTVNNAPGTRKRLRPPRKLKMLGVQAKYIAPATADLTMENFPTAPLYGNPNEIYVNAERRKFIQSITEKFMNYMKTNARITSANLRMHQQLVREYMNTYSPYRGLLLYHGLGSGKTCASIAIAEGMKDDRPILLLTPASLKTGFFNELKNCGDVLYKQSQNWTFLPLDQITPSQIAAASDKFKWTDEFVRKQGGIWISSIKKKPNYQQMDRATQDSLNRQLDSMIRAKYQDINYNGGFTEKTFAKFIENGNPFDNKTVIVDEAHNLVSRITNSRKKPKSISSQLYKLLLHSTNTKIVFLSGTPIINYAHEIAVLFNILRGAMKAWTFHVAGSYKPDMIAQLFKSANLHIFQYIQVRNQNISITRNPLGFVNRYGADGEFVGVQYDADHGFMSDEEFITRVVDVFRQNGVSFLAQGDTPYAQQMHYALPESADEFKELYVKNGKLNPMSKNALKKRIIGLTSYYQSPEDGNMPTIELDENGNEYHIVPCSMSMYQLGKYDVIRAEERKQEANKRDKSEELTEMSDKMVSTYKIRSRLACNFVFPDGLGNDSFEDVVRANQESGTELILEETDEYEEQPRGIDPDEQDPDEQDPGEQDPDEQDPDKQDPVAASSVVPKDRVVWDTAALAKLMEGDYLTPEGLATYSPKMAKILQNIQARPDGCHLVYSFFRTMEGVGIFGKVLSKNGFRPLEFHRVNGQWDLKHDLDPLVPNYAFYTGAENAEEREIVRNIQNSQWELLPDRIKHRLEEAYPGESKNYFGAALKCMLITSAAAEGINLKNILYVHLMEPYWNMGRLFQVIGRARRMNSHIHMPLDMQRIRVFLYIAEVYDRENISADQLSKIRQNYAMLVTKDVVFENDREKVVSTDETVLSIAIRKKNINDELLELIQNTSIDCAIYNTKGTCTTFGNVTTNEYGFALDYKQEDNALAAKQTLKATKIKYKGKEYLRVESAPNKYYMLDAADPQRQVGTAEKQDGKMVYHWAV